MNLIYFMAIGMGLICIPIVYIFYLVMRLEDRMWEVENFMDYISWLPAEEANHGEEE